MIVFSFRVIACDLRSIFVVGMSVGSVEGLFQRDAAGPRKSEGIGTAGHYLVRREDSGHDLDPLAVALTDLDRGTLEGGGQLEVPDKDITRRA